jgi:hypothetical protein
MRMPIGDYYMEAARSLAPFNDRFLLTGAWFSKPWEGYLAVAPRSAPR